MSSLTNPQGPLPSAVYWRRRALVIGAALLLVVGLGWLLTGASDGSDGDATGRDAATLVGQDRTSDAATTTAAPSTTPTVTASPRGEPADRGKKREKAGKSSKSGKAKKTEKTPLPAPDGECDPADVTVRPVVRDAVAGKRVDIDLALRTEESEACTWTASADTVTLKITSGDDDIWFSSQCPDAIATEDVVVRRDTTTRVTVPWDARRSDDGCTNQRLWAMPGWYHVQAAALAGEPEEVQFELTRPVSETITPSPTPKAEKKDRDRDEPKKDRAKKRR
jgi:hypothetical protein